MIALKFRFCFVNSQFIQYFRPEPNHQSNTKNFLYILTMYTSGSDEKKDFEYAYLVSSTRSKLMCKNFCHPILTFLLAWATLNIFFLALNGFLEACFLIGTHRGCCMMHKFFYRVKNEHFDTRHWYKRPWIRNDFDLFMTSYFKRQFVRVIFFSLLHLNGLS